jgi:ankyrin repeat protein
MKKILICLALLMSNLVAINASAFQFVGGEVYDPATLRSEQKHELNIFKRGSITAINKLLDKGFDINKSHPKTKKTPLIYACDGNRADVVELLIARGAKVNRRDDNGDTPLVSAIYNNNIMITKMLLQAGAKVNFRNYRGKTPLMTAIAMKSPELVDILIKARAAIQLERYEETALHEVARFGQIEAGEKLLKLGADLEAQDYSEQATPLMYAVEVKRPEMVKFLVSKGANVNAVSYSGRSVLMQAINAGNVEVVKCLLDNGAKVGFAELYRAANSDPGVLKAVLDKIGVKVKAFVSMKDREGQTLLMMGVFYDRAFRSTKNVEMLLAVGVDPTVKDIYGKGALDYAKEENNRRLIRMLERAVKAWQSKASK